MTKLNTFGLLWCLFLVFKTQFIDAQPLEQKIKSYLDSNRIALKNDRADLAIQYLIKAEALVETAGDIDFDLRHSLHYDYKEAFKAIGQTKIAVSHQRRVLEQIKQDFGSDRKEWLKMYYLNIGNMAGIFLSNQQFDSAYHYLTLALQKAKEYGYPRYVAGAYNNLGIYYFRNQEPDSAIYYYRQALSILEADNKRDSLFQLSVYDNIADWLIEKDSLVEAEELLNYNFITVSNKSEDFSTIFFRGMELLDLYLLCGKDAVAKELTVQLDSIVNLGSGIWWYDNKLALLTAKMQIANRANQKEVSLRLLKEHDSLQRAQLLFYEEYHNNINTVISRYINRSIENELIRTKEKALAEKESSRNKIILFSTCFIIALLFTTLLIVNYRRKLTIESTEKELAERDLQLTEMQNEKLNSELDYKNKDFSQLLMQTTLEEKWNQNIIGRLNTIKKQEDKSELLEDLIIELKQKSNFYDKLKVEQKGMLAANAAFYDRLSLQFPQLTKAEKETCGLMRMNIQTNELAQIRNIDPSSVRKLRQRIKKKLNLTVEDDLYEYIQNI